MIHARLLSGALLLALPCLANAQSTRAVTRAFDGGSSNDASFLPAISGDGRYVVFQSMASNLLPIDPDGGEDVFRRDVWTGQLELVSISLTGHGGNGPSRQGQISGDGRFVVFQSYASDLVPGDGNGESDIFVRDMLLGTTTRVSVSSSGLESNGGNRYPYISRDGKRIAFESHASNLVQGDFNGMKDVFVHDRTSGTTTIASLADDGSPGNDASLCTSISPDGRYVAFSSAATNLVPNDNNGEMDAFVRDMLSGTTVRISTDASGNEAHGLSGDVNLSADAHFAVFYSFASDLVPGDTNGQGDVFVKNLRTGAIERASVSSTGAQGNWHSYYPRISADGRYVVFFSGADTLVHGDLNWYQDAFLRDLVLGTTERISVTSAGHESRGISRFMAISDDGRFVAFESKAPNLDPPDDNATVDIFLRDRAGSFHDFCAGDGSGPVACPCANTGAAGRGCANISNAEGARLEARGVPAADTVELLASGMSGSLALFLQADTELPAPLVFGRGLRCIGGNLLRLYALGVSSSAASAPPASGLSIRARSALLGDTLSSGSTRSYQVWYRDAGGCGASPANVSNAVRVLW